ncbi:hypothetical protein CLS_04180 [[Clostridium] cf. saccharolyticum K10]|nr:hypothetical protein CLS_04180 [[Clostridium] cf. saccharolyticum K10]
MRLRADVYFRPGLAFSYNPYLCCRQVILNKKL